MRHLTFIIFAIFVTTLFSCSTRQDNDGIADHILTPKPSASPEINGPEVYGVRPGSPFLYRIPCTGERPIQFKAGDLPDGLILDEAKGIISGKIGSAGEYDITLDASNRHGKDTRSLKIVAGDKLALTPPMGWNSWYIHYDRISDKLMREAARNMISSGMADYGYRYVNIDDCWMVKVDSRDSILGGPVRDPKGNLIGNKKFPDMPGMTGYIHSLGLEAGIYISPGPETCAGYEGSFGHEAQDAATFAGWGFDFLKYDWCSYSEKAKDTTLEEFIKPYRIMSDELKKQPRDIIMNLCQYGMGEVWKWGATVGQSWRTTGDLGLEKDTHLPGFYSIGFSNARHWQYAGPGAWNDPDYILIGWVGDAHKKGIGHPTDLTFDEQYSYMSMWCLMAAPLIFSGDMSKLDEFTLNVLCNNEVIEVDQDPLGKQARILRKTDDEYVLLKPMEDGSLALGIFNLSSGTSQNQVSWSDLDITGSYKVRDLWRQKDIGIVEGDFGTSIPPHGVSLVRFFGGNL